MSEMTDLNTTLANLSVTFTNRVRDSLQQARDLEAQREQSVRQIQDNPAAQDQVRENFRPRIDRAQAMASLWAERANEAKSGNFLARPRGEMDDHEFVREFGQVMSLCQDQGRISRQARDASNS